MFDPATAAGRSQYGLDSPDVARRLAGVTFDLFRVRPGDDGSCLNLYRPDNPRIVARRRPYVGRAAAVSRSPRRWRATDAERANPWRLLDRRFDDGAVPAIVDATSLDNVFHAALGDDLAVPGSAGEPVRLRVVGTLSHSVFQWEILIGDAAFVRLYPQHEGQSGLWTIGMVDSRLPAVLARVLQNRLTVFCRYRSGGAAAQLSGRREHLPVAFQALGILGLLLGTLGLAPVILRNILERRRELALLSRGRLPAQQPAPAGRRRSRRHRPCRRRAGAAAALVAVQPAIARQAAACPPPPPGVVVCGGGVWTDCHPRRHRRRRASPARGVAEE